MEYVLTIDWKHAFKGTIACLDVHAYETTKLRDAMEQKLSYNQKDMPEISFIGDMSSIISIWMTQALGVIWLILVQKLDGWQSFSHQKWLPSLWLLIYILGNGLGSEKAKWISSEVLGTLES